jgi:large subunit ribosomal protein L16
MLIPKKVKHRKWQKGRSRGRQVELRGTSLSFGTHGLKALESGYLNSRQIEAARKTISNFIKREGKIWIRIFPDKPITKQPPEQTLGGGKGGVEYYVFPVKPGRVLFEMDGVSAETANRALELAGHKLPVRTKIISR